MKQRRHNKLVRAHYDACGHSITNKWGQTLMHQKQMEPQSTHR